MKTLYVFTGDKKLDGTRVTYHPIGNKPDGERVLKTIKTDKLVKHI